MIVDSPVITNLAVGTDRRIPQEGDSQLVIPATALPLIPLMSANQYQPGAAVTNDNSFTFSSTAVRTNQAAAIITFSRLAKGLWRLRFNSYFFCNYIGDVLGVDETSVRLKDEATGVLSVLYAFYPSNIAAQATAYNRHVVEVLLLGTGLIEISTPTNGVGETILFNVCLNAVRIL